MTRINQFRTATLRSTPATLDSVAWDKINGGKTNFDKNTSTLVFAALLIVCSLAVGCSGEKPKPESSTNQPAMTQPTQPIATSPATAPATPALQAAAKPVHKKVVRKVPATVTYADKTSGVSFQYPRNYALKPGDAADELVSLLELCPALASLMLESGESSNNILHMASAVQRDGTSWTRA